MTYMSGLWTFFLKLSEYKIVKNDIYKISVLS